MNDIYKKINDFNGNIINDNWLGRMIFGHDRQFQINTINFFLAEIRRSLEKRTIPQSNIPRVIHETLEILSDHSGATLLKYLKQSFGDKDWNKKELLSFEEQEKRKEKEIHKFIGQCKKVFDKWPSMSQNTHQQPESSNSAPHEDASHSSSISDIESIKLSRDLIFDLVKSRAHIKQLKTYKRFILLIQINCFMRSKGILLRDKGADIDHQYILKDAQDIIVFSAPILWPKRIMRWLEFDKSPNAPIFPNYLAREATVCLSKYDNLLSIAFDDILGLKINNNNNELYSKSSIDQVLTTCRRFAFVIVMNVHPSIKYT